MSDRLKKLFTKDPPSDSIVAIATNFEPLEISGRYILENGPELTNTILSEYKKRFNNAREFAEWILKFHWLKLSNTSFGSYMVSFKLVSDKKIQNGVPIYLGEKLDVLGQDESIEWATLNNINSATSKTIYIIDIVGELLITFEYNYKSNEWERIQDYDLKSLKSEVSEE